MDKECVSIWYNSVRAMDRTKNLIMVHILVRNSLVHILVRAMDRTKNLSIALTRMFTILVRAMDRTKNLSIMVNILVRAMDRT